MNQQQGQPQQFVLAVRPWTGSRSEDRDRRRARQGQRYSYYGMSEQSPQPRLFHHAGAVYVDTHVGIPRGSTPNRVIWIGGYGYKTDPPDAFESLLLLGHDAAPVGSLQQQHAASSRRDPVCQRAKSEQIFALNADQMKLLWDRPISKSARSSGWTIRPCTSVDSEIKGVGPANPQALVGDLGCPGGGAAEGQQISSGPEASRQLTGRGIFEIDPRTARSAIFRGDDTGRTVAICT